MKKIAAFLCSLLLSTAVLATDAFQAKCPDEMVKLEKDFWSEAVKGVDFVDGTTMRLEMECLVYKPALSTEEFKNMAMIMQYFTLYPDVIRPWETIISTTDGTVQVGIIRANIHDGKVDFIKVMYANNGNLFLTRTTFVTAD